MDEVRDRLGNLEIIRTGTLLARQGNVLSIAIPEISRKPLLFSVEIPDDDETYTEYENEDLENLYVKLVTGLENDYSATSSGNIGGVKIIVPGYCNIYFNYMVQIVGERTDYIYSLIYNVVREPV